MREEEEAEHWEGDMSVECEKADRPLELGERVISLEGGISELKGYGESHREIELENKESQTLIEGKFSCKHCSKVFAKKKGVSQHIRDVHRDRFACDLCIKSFTKSINLSRHKREVHMLMKGQYECNFCNAFLKRKNDLLKHMQKCKGKNEDRVVKKKIKPRTEKCCCETCNRNFTRLGNLKRHIDKQHKISIRNRGFMLVTDVIGKYKGKSKEYICYSCQRPTRFFNKFSLERHIEKKHEGRRDRIQIGSNFFKLSKEELKGTINRHELCSVCLAKFTCVQDLQYHLKEMHGMNKIQCMKCNKSYGTKTGLNKHMYKVHRDNNTECHICGKVFQTNYNLTRHHKTHLLPRHLKGVENISRAQLLTRMKKNAEDISKKIQSEDNTGRPILWRELLKQNSSIINNKETLTEEEVIQILKDTNISDRKMIAILKKIKEKWGKGVVTPNMRHLLIKRKALMKRFFSYRYLTSKSEICFQSKTGVPIPRYVVYCTDIPGLIAWKKLLEDDFDNEYLNIIGLDDGKSILKICWNWSKSEVDEGKYKLMGPKRSIILACVSDVPETSHNIKVLWDLCGVDEIDYLLSEDLKLHNITLGKQTHSSKHPCSYCNGYYNAKIKRWVKGEALTLENLENDRQNWLMETHGDRNRLKEFNNVEHAAIVKFDKNTKILHKIPPPPLHVCLLGPTNTILQNLEKVYPKITSILDSLFLPRESYQGKTYEGNIITKESLSI